MAERTEGTIEIDGSPAAIMAVIVDFDAYPEWLSDIKEIEVLERFPDGRASRVHMAVSAGPINARYTLAYTYEPNEGGVSWKFIEGSTIKDMEGEYRLQPKGDHTAVTYRLALDVAIPGPGFLKKRLLAEGEKRIIDSALHGLKERVESLG